MFPASYRSSAARKAMLMASMPSASTRPDSSPIRSLRTELTLSTRTMPASGWAIRTVTRVSGAMPSVSMGGEDRGDGV
jgi:hypothetical protein